MSIILRPVELIYLGLNRGRRSWYRAGFATKRHLPRPVVSIGNIAIGGGGKTPTVIAIAGAVAAREIRVAVLTRGFGGKVSGRAGQIVVPPMDPALYGDEPVLIARCVPEVDVVVGAKRWDSGLTYLVQRDCDLFILDDGFQHLQLHRDLDIVLDRPSARWHREGPSALQDADIVLRRVSDPSDDGEGTARMVVSSFSRGGSRQSVDQLRGARVFVFSGLADNAQFRETVAGLGCEVVGEKGFPDHHPYARNEIGQLRNEASRLDAIPVTSEKDGVKIDDPSIAVLEASMMIPSLDAIVERIVSLVRK